MTVLDQERSTGRLAVSSLGRIREPLGDGESSSLRAAEGIVVGTIVSATIWAVLIFAIVSLLR